MPDRAARYCTASATWPLLMRSAPARSAIVRATFRMRSKECSRHRTALTNGNALPLRLLPSAWSYALHPRGAGGGELAHDRADVGAEDFGQLQDGREAGDVASLLDDGDVLRIHARSHRQLPARPAALL